jgi:F-type H+-transporting ATPase subunit epsilon
MRLHLKILTLETVLLQDQVDSVSVPAIDGIYELLPNHAPIFITLGSGNLAVIQSGEIEQWFIDGGTCHMQDNQCTIMVHHILEDS